MLYFNNTIYAYRQTNERNDERTSLQYKPDILRDWGYKLNVTEFISTNDRLYNMSIIDYTRFV